MNGFACISTLLSIDFDSFIEIFKKIVDNYLLVVSLVVSVILNVVFIALLLKKEKYIEMIDLELSFTPKMRFELNKDKKYTAMVDRVLLQEKEIEMLKSERFSHKVLLFCIIVLMAVRSSTDSVKKAFSLGEKNS